MIPHTLYWLKLPGHQQPEVVEYLRDENSAQCLVKPRYGEGPAFYTVMAYLTPYLPVPIHSVDALEDWLREPAT